MPVDMVKILKTQDENYVRTMRSSNAKVSPFVSGARGGNLKRFSSQKIDRIKSQLSAMADLVRGDGEADEEELAVLEKSGVFASRKLRGKARPMNGPKHVVFVEEGEEGPSHLFSVACGWKFTSTMRLDSYEGPSNLAPAPETVSDDGSEIDLGWKPEGRQKRKKGKQKPQENDGSDVQLLEEESKVRCVLVPLNAVTDQKLRCSGTPPAAGSGAFSSDGAGPTVTLC